MDGSRQRTTYRGALPVSIGAWTPCWLDAPSRPLYAALHAGTTGSSLGGVLVPPFLHEAPRSRRFMTEVASALAALGLPCLRFDFRGTGDSSGDGGEVDFASMRADLDVATEALGSSTGVQRIALLAWRGAALLTQSWMRPSRAANLLVLWEPISDGAGWLRELEREDALERASRPRARPGVPRTSKADDGQLMGFAASPRFRQDLIAARLDGTAAQANTTWAVVPADGPPLPIATARVLTLPPGAPTFAGGASMEATLFLTPPIERVVERLGHALREEALG